jgi:hypothetical protein
MLPQASAGIRGTTSERRRLKAVLVPWEWDALQVRAKAFGVSPTVLLLTVFCEVLASAQTRRRAFTLIMTFFNRLSEKTDADSLMGPLANSSLFIARADQPTLEERCHDVQAQLWQDLDHAGTGSVSVLRELRQRRMVEPGRVLPVVFTSMVDNYLSTDFAENWSSDWVYAVTQTPQVELDHQACVRYGALHLSWDVAIGCVDEAAAQRLLRAYHGALSQLANNASVDIEALRSTIDRLQEATAATMPPAQRPVPPPQSPVGAYPLTDLQSAYLFGRLRDGDGAGCVVYQEFLLRSLDLSSLEKAWNDLVLTHGMLRAVIGDDGALRIRAETPRCRLSVEDLRPHSRPLKALDALRSAMANRGFAPDEWPLAELRVSRDHDVWRLHLSVDMLIADAPSIYQLYRDLFTLYQGTQTPVPGQSYTSYLERVVHAPLGKLRGAAEQYWAERFASIPSGPARLSLTEGQHRRYERELDGLAELRRYAHQNRLSLQDILFTAYMEVLEDWNDDEPFSVVVVDFERPSTPLGFEHCIGDFTWLSWVSSTDAPQADFVERVQAFGDRLTRDREHYPVSGLRALRRQGSGSRRVFNFPVVFSRLLGLCDVELPAEVQWGYGVSRTPHVCLDNVSVVRNGRLHVHWDVLEQAFAPGVVESLLNRYLARLQRLTGETVDACEECTP